MSQLIQTSSSLFSSLILLLPSRFSWFLFLWLSPLDFYLHFISITVPVNTRQQYKKPAGFLLLLFYPKDSKYCVYIRITWMYWTFQFSMPFFSWMYDYNIRFPNTSLGWVSGMLSLNSVRLKPNYFKYVPQIRSSLGGWCSVGEARLWLGTYSDQS